MRLSDFNSGQYESKREGAEVIGSLERGRARHIVIRKRAKDLFRSKP